MINPQRTHYVIKPSGVSYAKMRIDDMVVVELATNQVKQEGLKPSVDYCTHTILYQKFPQIQAIAHTHSLYASAFAQANCALKCFGTTHADNFYGTIPCTRLLKAHEIASDYETYTGLSIVEKFNQSKLDYRQTPACLVYQHGPFCWSLTNALDVVNLALTLETVAKMAYLTLTINPKATPLATSLLDKHHARKHSKNAYYGQTQKD